MILSNISLNQPIHTDQATSRPPEEHVQECGPHDTSDSQRPTITRRCARTGLPRLTNAERQRRYRERRRARTEAEINDQPDSNIISPVRVENVYNQLAATEHFNEAFKANSFGYACDICDRLWFKHDLKKIKESQVDIVCQAFNIDCSSFSLCASCRRSLDLDKIPPNSVTNGFKYPSLPPDLPPLDPITTRLISPRLPFMAIRRLRRDGSYGIIGQVINIPVDVDTMVRQLPRNLDDDYAFNVSIKRKLIHRSSYLSGVIKKNVLKTWLRLLLKQPLYRHFNITVHPEYMPLPSSENDQIDPDILANDPDPNMPANDPIEKFANDEPESEILLSRQQTLLWNEENVLEIAPAQGRRPLNIIFDDYAEELSFPQIYFGVARTFDPNVRVTPYMIANSEIRRKDRRGVTPEHILYMAMKILRLRVVDGIRSSFRCVRETENISRRMIGDPKFLEECIERNFSFLKSIPNSVTYWMSRKKDLFAMMRQFGKPTVFLTISANEVKWPHLLALLYKLRHAGESIEEDVILDSLDRSKRADLVNEDPVTCCVYFNKLVDVILTMIRSKRDYNPFGKYRVKDHFMRIEFQHRGSPHAHILLWLENDPKEQISENMPQTIQLITDLCSVNMDDLQNEMYQNQVHRHTFTCTKRGEASCRFNIPYWPMKSSYILIPLPSEHPGLAELRRAAKKVRHNLEVKVYEGIDSFLADSNIDEVKYLQLIRSTLVRPTICFKRDMSQIMTNTFNPWIAYVLNSNMDLQFILDEYSCAQYVVDYVNKSNRGTSNLHRELVKLNESHPELTHESLLRKLGSKILNTVEMSAQEAAWYLLRQEMSQCSRDVAFVPTMWPCERQKSYKTKAQLDAAQIDQESTDIWTKSVLQRYEERPTEMDFVCLADFATWYTFRNRPCAGDSGDQGNDPTNQNFRESMDNYYRRNFCRILTCRGYDSSDGNNFKREMVLLYVPFRNEQVDVLDRDKFLEIYAQNIQTIADKKNDFVSGCDIEQIIAEIIAAQNQPEERPTADVVVQRQNFVRDTLNEGDEENFDDFNREHLGRTISAVRTRANVLSKSDYCQMMRTTNARQRELVLEFIHRITLPESRPIQVFFTGPAGCGKTYVLKLIMETLNRYSQQHNILNNSYLACASTGKASVGIGGTTVHSAFHITQSRRQGQIGRENLHNFRQLFANVKCIIVDEVSMISNAILYTLESRLQQITGELEARFGGLHIVFCGDFRQLPPVNATPVYKGSRGHLEGASLWQSLDFFPLAQVMRQSDVIFSSILTKIGDGSTLTVEESKLIESRFRTQQWCDENLRGVVRLFHQNHLVDAFNSRAITGGKELIANDIMLGYSSNEELVRSRTKLHKLSTVETGGLPYCVLLATGYPYMLTSNSDIEDGLVNGAIGILRYIETIYVSDDQSISGNVRVWLELPEEKMGLKARLRLRSAIVSHGGAIRSNWTPISMKTASIKLGTTVRCKRSQLPLVPACAMTIHKSQGGTFDSAVIMYDKSQQNQLVYVALSRVKSIDGLYLINSKNDFTFHHKSGTRSPSIREIRDEYNRLTNHPLDTVTDTIDIFIDGDGPQTNCLNLCTINAQSLVAHSEDISTDSLITKSDMLVITETWMDANSIVEIQGYELVSWSNSARIGSNDQRTAGGVAIYRKVDPQIQSRSLTFELANNRQLSDISLGDCTFADVLLHGSNRLILCALYIHPGASKSNVELFLKHTLSPFARATYPQFSDQEIDSETPLVITGDFNSNIMDDPWILGFMRETFGLTYVNCLSPTTLGNTIIDLTFVRGLATACMPYVCYFSYHRPLFNKITFLD